MSESAPDCLLTFVVPPPLAERLADTLVEHPEWGARFLVSRAEGHGQAMPLAASAELVRGRTPRVVIQVALQARSVPALVEQVRRSLASPEIAYWAVPLSAFGRLT